MFDFFLLFCLKSVQIIFRLVFYLNFSKPFWQYESTVQPKFSEILASMLEKNCRGVYWKNWISRLIAASAFASEDPSEMGMTQENFPFKGRMTLEIVRPNLISRPADVWVTM